MKFSLTPNIALTVLVAALGYFVDIYDLVLFSIVRVASLKSMGLQGAELLNEGVYLLNAQMFGMLLGGVLWGIVGDRKGRLSVLFGSITLYSLANLLNAHVTSVHQYGFLRFVAGIGLAGELGAAMTLVSEILPAHSRGKGTTFVATVGVSGAIFAAWVGQHFTWQWAYSIGGLLGLMLLVLRIRVCESGLFHAACQKGELRRGDLRMLFFNRARFKQYLACVLTGVPIWYVIGILITFAPELSKEFKVVGEVTGGHAIMMCYLGLVLGDFASGLLSQIVKSRKKVVGLFLGITTLFVTLYCHLGGLSAEAFYALCLGLGFGTGYWAVFVSTAAELFGTNLRATAATTAPNFVRGAVVPVTLLFQSLNSSTHGTLSLTQSAYIVGIGTISLAFIALIILKETFGKDLNYYEDK